MTIPLKQISETDILVRTVSRCQHSALATSDADGFGKNATSTIQEIRSNQEWKPRCTGGFVFRVDKEFGEQRTRLTVSGEISSACIEVLETSCEQTIKDGKAVHLVVTTIDESGRALRGASREKAFACLQGHI